MEIAPTFAVIGYFLYYAITAKAECDYWNSHSESFKQLVWLEVFVGLLPFFWMFSTYNSGDKLTVPKLVFFDYICVCLVINGYCQLNEKSGVSKNFSEFWLFGFFKTDNFLYSIFVGAIGAIFCTWSLLGSINGAQATPKTSAIDSAPAVHKVVSQHSKAIMSAHHKKKAKHQVPVQ